MNNINVCAYSNVDIHLVCVQLETLRGQIGVERYNGLLATLSRPVLKNLGDFVRYQ